MVQLAANGGYDALFIDLEHSTLSVENASQLCVTGLHAGITPFVRVPYQCGDGFVQRVLDGGAMGVVFPHIHDKSLLNPQTRIKLLGLTRGPCLEDAIAAVSICKYPPMGKRSMTGQLPYFSLKPTPPGVFVTENNAKASSVLVMMETQESIKNADEIASVEGVDVLLIGSNDLATELGVPAQFKSEEFQSAVESVSRACKKHGKIFGLAGIYENAELQDWGLNKLEAGFTLVQQDSGVLAAYGKACADAITKLTGR